MKEAGHRPISNSVIHYLAKQGMEVFNRLGILYDNNVAADLCSE
jgi:hypothetical protein